MDLKHSEEMMFFLLKRIPAESARALVPYLGKLVLVEFNDVSMKSTQNFKVDLLDFLCLLLIFDVDFIVVSN